MLYLEYRNKTSSHVISYLNKFHIKNKFMRSLQAQGKAWQQKKTGTPRFVSCKGAVTVEAVLVVPIFLSVMCGLLMMGTLLLTEAKIQYALTRTADIYAAQKAVEKITVIQKNRKKNDLEKSEKEIGKWADILWKTANLQVIFSSVCDASVMIENSIVGGRKGIAITSFVDEEKETVEIIAVYRLKIEVPFINYFSFFRKISAQQRIYGGYVEQGAEKDSTAGDIVYVTENGSVYHTSLSCTHICLHISGSGVEKLLSQKKYQPCEKCISETEQLSSLYITKYGDKYHSTLNCSGLKRTVKTIAKEEAKGMRMCSRCAAQQ